MNNTIIIDIIKRLHPNSPKLETFGDIQNHLGVLSDEDESHIGNVLKELCLVVGDPNNNYLCYSDFRRAQEIDLRDFETLYDIDSASFCREIQNNSLLMQQTSATYSHLNKPYLSNESFQYLENDKLCYLDIFSIERFLGDAFEAKLYDFLTTQYISPEFIENNNPAYLESCIFSMTKRSIMNYFEGAFSLFIEKFPITETAFSGKWFAYQVEKTNRTESFLDKHTHLIVSDIEALKHIKVSGIVDIIKDSETIDSVNEFVNITFEEMLERKFNTIKRELEDILL